MIRAAIVGFGLSGKTFHYPLLRAAGFEVSAIVVSDPGRHKAPDGVYFASLDAVCENGDIDLVVVCSPNPMHHDHGLRAIRAGKHVVIEKPLASTVEEASALCQAAGRSQGVATVFHSRRWDGDFLTLRRLLREGAVGDWQILESRWGMNKPVAQKRWKDNDDLGGGLLADFMPHMIDQALCLFGLPDRVDADIATQRVGGIGADYVAVTMRYGSKRVSLATDCFSSNPGWRFRLAGTMAEYICMGTDQQEAQLRAGMSPSAPDFGLSSTELISRLAPMSGEPRAINLDRGNYLGFYNQLKVAIAEGQPVPVDISEAANVVAIIDSLRTTGCWTPEPSQTTRLP
ncbi:Gfo/Idh/MocA family oxidoreductase [Mesorhizobium sp. M0047]|uniref:Gfo/Idh/MocA family oxidoreductase n=1 Tax=Mesorhizobium sp. M0047 TaxID=2956859 RepID=UPI003337A7EA